MPKIVPYILYATVLVLTSCNNDIFVDETGQSQETEAYIEGDGGDATFTISFKGLERISIDNLGNDNGYTYFNRAGQAITFLAPASGQTRTTAFTTEVTEPVRSEITVKHEE